MAGSVMTSGRAAIQRHVFLLQHQGSSSSWPSKLELDLTHPLSELNHLLDKKTTHTTAVEPVCPLSTKLTERTLSKNAFACLDFNGAPTQTADGRLVCASTVPKLLDPAASKEMELDGIDVMVCVHGARDERCGVLGPALIARLSEEAASSGIEVRLWGASHYGGHRFAPNALVFPGGHWFGMLDHIDNGHDLLTALTEPSILRNSGSPPPPTSELRQHWRGCMGLSKQSQIHGVGGVVTHPVKDHMKGS
jgi:hypothetical protein